MNAQQLARWLGLVRWMVLSLLGSASLGALAQAPADPYNYSRTSSFTYYGSSDGAKNGLLKTETVEPNNPQLCVVTTYVYDDYGNKMSATSANCAGATGAAVFSTRDSSSTFGAVASQTITVGASTTAVPIPAGVFATSAENALNQLETRTFDPRFGAALSVTGPNGLTSSVVFDDFGRKTKEIRADGTSVVTAYCVLASSGLDTTSNSNTANGDPMTCPNPTGEAPADAVMFVHSFPRNTAGAKMGPFVRVYTDRLGREMRTITESFDGEAQTDGYAGVKIVKDTVYNTLGVRYLETQPYFLGTGATTTTGSYDVGVSMITVDALGRTVAAYTADTQGAAGAQDFGGTGTFKYGRYGSRNAAKATMAYAGLTVTTTNDKGQTRKEEKNARGELVRVTDASGAQVAYQRDAFGNLLTTKDALQNKVTVTYDIRGRKTRLNDPDLGVMGYCHDALGQLVAQQSSKMRGNDSPGACPTSPNTGAVANAVAGWTTVAYDLLGRMASRVEPEFSSTWHYDKYADGSACTKGIGKLCETKTSNGIARKVVYDSLGRPKDSRTTITNGPSFASTVTYEASTGRLSTQTYPTGVRVAYNYTSRGFLQKLVLKTAAVISPLPNANGQTASSVTWPVDTVLWQAQVVNAWSKTEAQTFGNGIQGRAVFDPASGRITDLTAGSGSSTSVLAQHYTWDNLGNLTARNDDNGDGTSGQSASGAVTESFVYGDSLNRLTSYTVAAPGVPGLSRTVNLHYNALGMLLHKSDVGNYTYKAQGGTDPHALQSVDGAIDVSFGYDANGNVTTATAGKYRSLSYTSFNLPDDGNGAQGPSGSPKYTWQYDDAHARVKETRIDGSGTRTTWYLHPDNRGGLGFESETAPSGAFSNRHYLTVGGQAIGVIVTTAALPTLTASQTAPTYVASIAVAKLEYWHKDHLGGLITTTDHLGTVTQRYAYDPFGKRRYTHGSYDAFGNVVIDWSPLVNFGSDRGFTGHEHLDDIGLVHMNGRIFDPTLGVFLQGDPLIQDPGNLQNYNRYGYCLNNPMGCVDPSGFCFMGCFWQPKVGLRMTFDLMQRMPGQAAIDRYIMKHQWAYAVGQFLATTFTPYCGGCGGAIWTSYYTYQATGSIDAAMRSGAISYASTLAFSYIDANVPLGPQNILMNAAVGGFTSRLQGGSFEDGFRTMFIVSTLTYVNSLMRDSEYENSSLAEQYGGDSNTDGVCGGWRGDGRCLAGARREYPDYGSRVECVAPLGACQGGANAKLGDIESGFFGFEYDYKSWPGSWLDAINESFAGPHDWFRNVTGSYDSIGNAIHFTGWRLHVDSFMNMALVIPAAPLGIVGLAPASSYYALSTFEVDLDPNED